MNKQECILDTAAVLTIQLRPCYLKPREGKEREKDCSKIQGEIRIVGKIVRYDSVLIIRFNQREKTCERDDNDQW